MSSDLASLRQGAAKLTARASGKNGVTAFEDNIASKLERFGISFKDPDGPGPTLATAGEHAFISSSATETKGQGLIFNVLESESAGAAALKSLIDASEARVSQVLEQAQTATQLTRQGLLDYMTPEELAAVDKWLRLKMADTQAGPALASFLSDFEQAEVDALQAIWAAQKRVSKTPISKTSPGVAAG